jgi:hypothetical protein
MKSFKQLKLKLLMNDILKEDTIAADKKAGIKWADDPDWKKLHDMDLQMIKDFLKHKE